MDVRHGRRADHETRPGSDVSRRGPRDFALLVASTGSSNLADGIGTIAFPWLATATTRSPLLIATIVTAQRLPWLLFSLPAGVVVDRYDRRRIMAAADLLRGLAVAVVAAYAWLQRDVFLALDQIDDASTNLTAFGVLLAATLTLGSAEVLRDNAGQALTPAVVDSTGLERANGRMWVAERATNTLLGPAIGSVLLIAAYALPFVIESVAFFTAAGLVMAMSKMSGTAHRDTRTVGHADPFGTSLRTGLEWLWAHTTLRAMAIALAGLNLAGWIGAGTFVLFAQEVMGIGPTLFAVVGFGGAIGGVIGGFASPLVSARIGRRRSLVVAVSGLCAVAAGIAAFPRWPVVLALSIVEFFCVALWSVVSLSFRQSVIPDDLLGRVNASHRFFGWGAIPIGAALSGATVAGLSDVVSRTAALRSVWIIAAIIYAGVLALTIVTLTEDRLQSTTVHS